MPDGWQRWLDWLRTVAPDNEAEIKALEADGGHGEALLARLRRFLLRTNADIDPLDWRAVALRGPGAVAAAAVMYLGLSLLLGLVERYLKPPLWLATLIFVPATFAVCWAGTKLSTLLVFGPTTWAIAILGYCVVASLLPVWLLLQPRGYRGGFVLYSALGLGTTAIGGLVFEPTLCGPLVGVRPPSGAPLTSTM